MDKRGSAALTSVFSAAGLAIVVGGVLLVDWPKANALPSFARQTGQQCAACHNGFPELTPYGREFKLNGYTFGGGNAAQLGHFAGMVLGSYTNTQAGQTGGAAQHFGPNGNFAVDQASLFYGGAITSHLGVFSQATYDGVARQFHWDNVDIRYARPVSLFGSETILGVTVNNNPSAQDVWNTTPAWGYPYVASALAPGPAAGTMIEGGFGQLVAGVTAYAYWNRLVYIEVGGYKTLSNGPQCALGVGCAGTNNAIRGIAPYWRAALQHDWSRHSIEAGVFGMAASIIPGQIYGFGEDHVTDVGFDAQYQYLSDRNSFSTQVSEILENQNLSATTNPGIGGAANGHNKVRDFHIKATYYRDQTYGASVAIMRLDGTPDPVLYPTGALTGSPNSTGVTTELTYIPFNHGGPGWWPWLNVKFGAQYTFYPEFNGQTGNAATRNNTLYLYSWLAF